jgi:hypothetical protein
MSLQTASPSRGSAEGGVSDGPGTTEPASEPSGDMDSSEPTDAYTIVARPEGAEAAAKGANGGSETEEDDEAGDAAEIDDLEAAIAEDAAAAAPARSAVRRQSEPDQYDWDSVIRGRTEPLFRDRPLERANLTALPPLDEPSSDTAAAKMLARPTEPA